MSERGCVVGRRAWRSARAVVACASLVLAGMAVPAAVPAVAASTPAGCAAPAVGQVGCGALTAPGHGAVTKAAVVAASSLPSGFAPLSLRYAYGLEFQALSGGVGQTVAVVTAYDDATAESDMGTYRSEYGIPACTTADGCFSKVNETGGDSYPAAGPAGWSLATAQALDMISAICPNCHVTLVEANSTAIADLGTAENEAVTLGAKFVTNTWFTPEATYGSSEPTYDSEYFNHPGVAITAPDGNGAGYGVYYPAVSPDVIAVGGTTLTADSATARGWTETAWSGTGSGCSAYEAKPSWQTDTGCTTRMANDVSAVADPTNSAVAFFDTNSGGWVTGGGNNVAAAIIAAAFALAGTPAAGSYPASYLYAHTSEVNDVTTGSDGTCSPAPAYFCTAGTGYDGPTGVGTPASAAALGATAPAESLPAGPVAYNPANGDQELYITGTNGTAWQDSLSPSTGTWSGPGNLSGDVYGRPAAVFDPASGNLEVYARESTSIVYEDFWESASQTWSGWGRLGGSAIEGNPAAIYNPVAGALQVFETGQTGTVFGESWTPSKGWSGWQNMGGVLGSGPDAVYDPVNNDVYLVGSGTNGTVWLDVWSSATSTWSGWQNMGGDLSGTPSTVYDPLDGAIEIYGDGPSSYVYEDWQLPGGGWSGWYDRGGSAIEGSPSAVYNPLANALQVYETGQTGTVFEASWTLSGGWSTWQNMGATLSNGPDAVYDLASGSLEVYGIGTSGAIFENSWTSAGWKGWKNLGSTFGDL